jgi:excisionase family DNA binding protein
MRRERRYSTREVAEKVGVSKETILRWLRTGKVPEPDRDRNGWRIFSDEDVEEVLRYKNRVIPSPKKVQRKLFNK